MITKEEINRLIKAGELKQAIVLLQTEIKSNPKQEEAYYLMGNIYLKKGEYRLALNNYLTAMNLNPKSPAHIAYEHIMNILNFYNKDMFNQ